MQALEPLGFVVALCVMSMGVITLVEGTVPTRAEYEDAQRLIEARENMRAEVRELAETLDEGWAPSFQESEDLFFGDGVASFGAEVDPFSGLIDLSDGETTITAPAIAKAPSGAKF